MIRVLIVDDHVSVCDSITAKLESVGGFSVVGKIPKAEDAALGCQIMKPDLIFMDVCTDGNVSGLEAIKVIRDMYPDIKIIVMSGFDEVTYMPRAKEIGAHAFVFKSMSLESFVDAAKAVMRGETSFPQPVTVTMPTGEAPLTEREMEVLRLLCKYMSAREIAEELIITESTVKFHKKNMLEKTGFSKMADLAFHMINNGWINPRF
jgi:DNA-binding NarL/FixJ family response regulator